MKWLGGQTSVSVKASRDSAAAVAGRATIANDGVVLRPHFVREIRDKDGNLIKSFASQEGRQVLSSDVAKAFAGVMRSVVVNGSGGQAEIEGYRVAGKTETAQVARTDGRVIWQRKDIVLVGFAPR